MESTGREIEGIEEMSKKCNHQEKVSKKIQEEI